MRRLITACVFCISSASAAQLAIAPLSTNSWNLDGDEKRCVVKQIVPDWGQISVESSVRGELTWLFSPMHPSQDQRPIALDSVTPPWQHPIILDFEPYEISSRGGHFVVEGRAASRLMRAVDAGRMARLSYRSGGKLEEVGAMPVGLAKVSADFQKCINGLPLETPEPPSITAARRKIENKENAPDLEAKAEKPIVLKPWVAKNSRELSFPTGNNELNEQRKQILFDMVADYLMAPATATLAIITPNDETARLRAEKVGKYLTEQGMEASMLEVKIDPAQSGIRLEIRR